MPSLLDAVKRTNNNRHTFVADQLTVANSRLAAADFLTAEGIAKPSKLHPYRKIALRSDQDKVNFL
eukprot:CAMPEP_0175174774 /NCGR_PEP_ID=MMETSP0087-20121206/32827_1 /TAXON_ID=136419 /ORGANISM="Unknown Unknown, Strain D1" /LENGTH=65 /DNA_ID=CAMNT_0016466297 /DNA_START=69 /DNA_END=263 /DNA_ORIENTATION=-